MNQRYIGNIDKSYTNTNITKKQAIKPISDMSSDASAGAPLVHNYQFFYSRYHKHTRL